MVDDLNLPVAIRTVATVREPDGLAMSSRNRYLDPDQRRAATVLSSGALSAAARPSPAGERDADRVRQILPRNDRIRTVGRLDYAEVADAETLEPLDAIEPGRRAVALLAVRVGPTRLIDNADPDGMIVGCSSRS